MDALDVGGRVMEVLWGSGWLVDGADRRHEMMPSRGTAATPSLGMDLRMQQRK